MNQSQPKVSVILNCLNAAQDLEAAFNSLKAQTCQDFEVVFYDNCSTDQSPELAKNFGPKLRYFRGTETVPLGCARNLAIEKAQGEFIAFLDCDDLWRPSKLEKELACFSKDPDLGLVCTDTVLFNGQKELGRVFTSSPPARGHVFRELLTRQWISMSSAMIRRSALDSLLSKDQPLKWFDEKLNVCEEADVFYRLAHDWKLDYVAEPLTLWRIHANNTTFRRYGQFAEETFYILEKLQKLYPGFAEEEAGLVELLTTRANFQKAVDLWSKNQGTLARKTITEINRPSLKHRLFYLASYLPSSFFNLLARLYFALPSFLRR